MIGCLVLLAISAFSEAKVVAKGRWQKMFRKGKYARDHYDSDFTYNFKRTLHMHRGQEGYTVKNQYGRDVLVTKPFRFKLGGASCPKYQITCPRGQASKEMSFTSINLPYKIVPKKFRNPWTSQRCRLPPVCAVPPMVRRL